MKRPTKCCVLILAATVVAFALRVPRLGQRPMHGDEAVHADKFGDLLEKGVYTYDPNEYHGPSLNYFTLIPAKLCFQSSLVQVNEFTLRIVPVFFGVLVVLLLLLLTGGLGGGAAVYGAFLTALSPAMVFYSRYYIQEMLLVCFTFGVIVSGYRYAVSGKAGWVVGAGVFLGLMHATKETCVIAFGCMFLALLVTMLLHGRASGSALAPFRRVKPWHLAAGIAAAVLVSALFFSSFFTNPGGILSSLATYATYFDRAGNNPIHIHPWHYYLQMLIYSRYADGPVWTEVLIVLLAVVGFTAAVTKRGIGGADGNLLRFIALYTAAMTVLYSAIPYKTPWCLLGFLHGMILLAGFGAVVLVRLAPNVLPRLIILCVLVETSGHLAWQSYLANYRYYADSRNPYVYAHPTDDVFALARCVEEAARVHPQGYGMKVQVICPGHDYWPIPWYLRRFDEKNSVYWWDRVPGPNEPLSEVPAAPVIIASPQVQEALGHWLSEWIWVKTPFEERQMYLPLFDNPYYLWLRPKVELTGFVRKDLWDGMQPPDGADELIGNR
jgi:uncharacterized protein (TIGR03663 family)